MYEQIQQQAKQLGVGEDIAQQLGQTASQFGTDTNINTDQQIKQQAKQLGVGEDIAQQLGQTDFTNRI